MFELPLYLIFIACLTVAFASAIQTAMGFGLALIAVPILLLIDTAMVPAPVVMVSIAQLLTVVWLNRAKVQWPMIRIAFVGRIPGTLLAMVLMNYFGESGLKIFIAVAVITAVVMSLFKFNAEPNQKNHLIAGFFAGISGTISGIGGPPMALLYQNQRGDFIRANLSAFLLFGSMLSLTGMGLVGFVTVTSWLYGALFIPSIFIGVWFGHKIKDRLKPTFMRPAILTLCTTSAIAVIITTLS